MNDLLQLPEPTPAETYQEQFVPAIFQPLSRLLIGVARPGPGERVLDVACGTGVVARAVAPMVGSGGEVLAVDLNPGMLEVARTIPPPGGAAIRWLQGDVTAMDLPPARFHLALCQQGVQFFPDRVAGLRRIRSALRPGGRFCMAVWESLDLHQLWREMAEIELRHLGPLGVSREDVLAPFSLSDAGELRRLLAEAEFGEVQLSQRSIRASLPAERFVEVSERGYAAVIPQFASEPALFDEYLRNVERAAAPLVERHRVGGRIEFSMHTHIALSWI